MQVAELEQRGRALSLLDSVLELLHGETVPEVMRAHEVDDRRPVAVPGAQRALSVAFGGHQRRLTREVTPSGAAAADRTLRTGGAARS